MDLTDWHKIKEEVYYWDGSWRDIYVLDTTQNDWGKWIDLVNQSFSVEFYNGQTQKNEASINKQLVFDYFNRKTDLGNDATIKFESIIIKCHFFTVREIENDIDPREIVTIDDHNRLMDYLKAVSNALDKTVILTAESMQDLIDISVAKDNVQINID